MGEKASAILEAVTATPRPVRQLASDLQLAYSDTHQAVKRLVRAGDVRYGEQLPGAHDRPQRVIEPAGDSAPPVPINQVFP